MSEGFDNNINEYNSDVVSGVEQAPKKKGVKAAAIAVAAVVLVGGGSAIAYNCSDFVKNKVKLATLEPEEYYAWVTEKSAEELSKSLSESYEKYLDQVKKGQSASVSFKYEASDAAKNFLIDEADVTDQELLDFINGINTIEIGSEAQAKENLSAGSAFLAVNDDKLASVDFKMDMNAAEMFFRIPELKDQWLGIDETTLGDALDSLFMGASSGEISSDPTEIITPEELETLVNRYVGVWTESISDAEIEKKEEIDICDISVKYTVITSEIDQKRANKIAENFIEEASKDKLLKEIVTERLEICTADEYDADLEDALSDLKDADVDDDSETVNLTTYVDAKGTIRGMAVEVEKEMELSYVVGLDGDNIRGEFFYEDGWDTFEAELTAEKDGKKYSGDIEVKITDCHDWELDDQEVETTEFSVEFDKLEVVNEDKGYISGDITLVIPDIDPISLSFGSDGKSQDISFSLNIDGSDYGKFTLSMSQDKFDESKIPETKDALIITDDFDITSYVSEDDVAAFVADILKKIGINDADADALADELASSMFYEDDYYDDWDYDYDDWDYDDDDWDYDDDDWDYDDDDWSYDDSQTAASEEAFLCLIDKNYSAYYTGSAGDTLSASNAKLNGNGTYTISVTNSGSNYDIQPEGLFILAICAYDADAYANAQFTVSSIKIDGTSMAYTTNECETQCYDGDLEAYLYIEGDDESNIFNGSSVGEWSTIEVTFTVSGV